MNPEILCHLVDFASFPSIRLSLTLGYLQAFAEADPRISGRCEFDKHSRYVSAPTEDAWTALERSIAANRSAAHVVGFTNYFWSRPLNLELARRVKAAYPATLVVFGGNDVTNQATSVFADHSPVDVLVHGEGEVVFANVLADYLNRRDCYDLHHIPGVSFRDRTGTVVTTAAEPRIRDLDCIPSPFQTGACSASDIAASMMVMYEFSRGCPFKCSFCYWGGAVGTQTRRFSHERIKADLRTVITHMQSGATIFIADANFGMTDSDVETARVIVEVATQLGKRIRVFSNWAKNTNRRVIEAATILFRSELIYNVTLSAQSMNPQVLEIAQRKNIPYQYYSQLHKQFRELKIPTYTELIFGMPGESYATFLRGVEAVMDVNGAPVIYPLLLLNNTEYNEPQVRATYAVQTRFLPYQMFDESMLAEVVIGHDKLPYEDWLKGIGLKELVPVVYDGILKFVLTKLKTEHGIGFGRMLDLLLEYCMAGRVHSHHTFQRVFSNFIDSWKSPKSYDLQLMTSILGEVSVQHGTPHYQALMKVLVDDVVAAKALIRELAGVVADGSGARIDPAEYLKWVEFQHLIMDAICQAAKGTPGRVSTTLDHERLLRFGGNGIIVEDDTLRVQPVFKGYSFNLFIYYLQYGCIDTLDMFESVAGPRVTVPESTPRMLRAQGVRAAAN